MSDELRDLINRLVNLRNKLVSGLNKEVLAEATRMLEKQAGTIAKLETEIAELKNPEIEVDPNAAYRLGSDADYESTAADLSKWYCGSNDTRRDLINKAAELLRGAVVERNELNKTIRGRDYQINCQKELIGQLRSENENNKKAVENLSEVINEKSTLIDTLRKELSKDSRQATPPLDPYAAGLHPTPIEQLALADMQSFATTYLSMLTGVIARERQTTSDKDFMDKYADHKSSQI